MEPHFLAEKALFLEARLLDWIGDG